MREKEGKVVEEEEEERGGGRGRGQQQQQLGAAVRYERFVVTKRERKLCCPGISQVVPSAPAGKGGGDGRCSVGKCRSGADRGGGVGQGTESESLGGFSVLGAGLWLSVWLV